MREVMTYLLTNNLVEAEKEILRLKDENAELTKALTGLTCGGSEFFVRKGDRYVADIDACVSWVRRAKEDAHRRALDAIKARQASVVENEKLRAALEEAVGALETFAIMANEDTAYLPDEHVVSLTYDDSDLDDDLGGPNTLLGERFMRAFRRAREVHTRLSTPPPGGEHPQQSGGE